MIRVLAAFVLCLVAAVASAAPQRYTLDAARSQVDFTYAFQGREQHGTMPVQSVDMMLDLDNLPASRVSVTLDAHAARAGFVFATNAMRGSTVLDTDAHPQITFHSTSIRGSLRGAAITGQLTIRGVTRPVTLKAGLYRQQGTARTDRDHLVVLLTGEVSRAAFGASGYPDMVGDPIGLRIVAVIGK
ncbi:MAG: YceI family protein [Roseovarius sp.]